MAPHPVPAEKQAKPQTQLQPLGSVLRRLMPDFFKSRTVILRYRAHHAEALLAVGAIVPQPDGTELADPILVNKLLPAHLLYGRLTVDEARDIVAGRLIRQERRNLVGGDA